MRFAFVLFSSFVVASGLAMSQTASLPAEPITYTRDIAPILHKNCTGCHRPGQGAPMSLLTYKDVRPWARPIRSEVVQRQMPPWFADRHIQSFSNDPSLSEQEIDLISRWVAAGAPRGDGPDPDPPQYPDGWQIGTPDLVLVNAKPVSVPAAGVLDYVNIEIPTNLEEDKWVQALEVRPSDRRVVHHSIVFVRSPKLPGMALTPRPEGQFCSEDVCGNIEPYDPNTMMFTGTAVGTPPDVYPAGTAKLLPAGSVLSLQVHYTTIGTATTDQLSIGLVFAKEPPKIPLKTVPLSRTSFVIPPRAANHVLEATIDFNKDVTVWSIAPHAHLRGKSWRFELVDAEGNAQPVLSVPRFDFNWQLVYRFSQPLTMTRGTRVRGVAVFDNSSANRDNPNPDAEVRSGSQTTDEMLFAAVVYSVGSAAPPQ